MFHRLADRFIVAAQPDTVWQFFSAADNLPKITPASLSFELLTPTPITIQQDAKLDYRIRSMGIPLRWTSLIVAWEPPRMFIDLQVRGPYDTWCHRHTFTPVDGGVECTDQVVYRVPVPVIGPIVHALVVRRQLLTIFRYRRTKIAEMLGPITLLQADVEITRI